MEFDIPDKTLIMMIGLPFSGKTTFVEKEIIKDMNEFVIVSKERLKTLMAGEADVSHNTHSLIDVMKNYFYQDLLLQGKKIVLDEYHISKKERMNKIGYVKEFGYTVVGVFLGTPVDECLNRAENEMKKRMVKQVANHFEVPTNDEGYDKLIAIDHEDSPMNEFENSLNNLDNLFGIN